MCRSLSRAALIAIAALLPASAAAQQHNDSAYTARIRELTPTDPRWKFTTELVDHLPASPTVPTPLDVVGYVPGTIGKLSYVADINRYFAALDSASPRVKVVKIGTSDGGREMVLAIIANESTIERIDDYRAMAARLADPRELPDSARDRLIREAKPIYWLTGSIHSPETGSPEMLMELAYRLAVEESEFVRGIRESVITLITPVLEVDGRDRMLDTYAESRQLGLGPRGVSLVYWGKYTAHDNNRDGMVASQRLTRTVMRTFLRWHPTVMHDLHESVAFLYTSTGTGPYNEQFDPIVVDEWHALAYQEIMELTRRGLPGVWTHGFYDGWAPNYILAIANLHNSVGKFYETYTSNGADCETVSLRPSATSRIWYRPNPPVNGVKWCIRSNINYQQSGVLIALRYVADRKATFLENFAAKADRMVESGQRSAPYAYVIPRGQRHAGEAADLVNLFRLNGVEIRVADEDFSAAALGPAGRRERPAAGAPRRDNPRAASDTAAAKTPARRSGQIPVEIHEGDWIIRMDQPYTATVRTVLSRQSYSPSDPTPYDDTGWTLDELRHVTTYAIADSSILGRSMREMVDSAVVEGRIAGKGGVLLVAPVGDWRSAVLPWKAGADSLFITDEEFEAADRKWPAGTFILRGNSSNSDSVVRALGLSGTRVGRIPDVEQRRITLPRIALVHSWLETQNEGWVRHAFERMGVPFTYLADQELSTAGLLDDFDVVMYPHVNGSPARLINGRPMTGPPIPWKKSDLTPNLGVIDQTDDIRPALGLDGAAALKHFVERGGVLITTGNTTQLPIYLGFNPTVSVDEPSDLETRGAIFRAEVKEPSSPIVYGYRESSFPVYFNARPVLQVEPRDTSEAARRIKPEIAAQVEAQRARAILAFHSTTDSLLVSGLLANGEELAGKAAVVDAPLGEGHMILFGIRPFWRWETQGSFALALNAMANWNALHLRSAESPGRSEQTTGGRR